MEHERSRRDFLNLVGLGGVVFASGLAGWACSGTKRADPGGPRSFSKSAGAREDFFFLQLSDTHWGYAGAANPRADTTLKETVAAINASPVTPDFIIFSGDLTHTTDDPAVRRRRLGEFRDIVSGLRVGDLRFIPGEHDASLDAGAAYTEYFGDTFYSFDRKGVHFVALDNVSDPHAAFGDAQLEWLAGDLAKYDPETPIVVFAHRPMFDLYPSWDWATSDGAKAIAVLEPYPHVTVFYGHIHQIHHATTGAIAHHSAPSLIFPLPAPGSVPMKAPVAWDDAHPYRGLGYREIEGETSTITPALTERSMERT